MVDSWEVWTDFHALALRPLAGAKCGSVMTRQKVRKTAKRRVRGGGTASRAGR